MSACDQRKHIQYQIVTRNTQVGGGIHDPVTNKTLNVHIPVLRPVEADSCCRPLTKVNQVNYTIPKMWL
jgi:hypothetical protein